MSALLKLSSGVLIAPLVDTVIAYDLVTEVRHRLSLAAGVVLDACDGITDRNDIANRWGKEVDVDVDVFAEQVDAVLVRFLELGLVERDKPWRPPVALVGASSTTDPGMMVGRPHRVLDRTVWFRSGDSVLISRVEEYLGTSFSDSNDYTGTYSVTPGSSLVFEVNALSHGEYELVTDHVASHDALGTLLRRLVTVTNEYAVGTDGCLALHAGGVRSQGGRIVVLPSVSGGGKSTLTAALVAAGWDYLGDETIGIDAEGNAFGYAKRIALDPNGRAMLGLPHDPDQNVDPTEIRSDVQRLGGKVGRVTQIIFPSYTPGSECQINKLSVEDCFDALLANTLNLARVGQVGLETLCMMAGTIDAYRLSYGDALDATTVIADLTN